MATWKKISGFDGGIHRLLDGKCVAQVATGDRRWTGGKFAFKVECGTTVCGIGSGETLLDTKRQAKAAMTKCRASGLGLGRARRALSLFAGARTKRAAKKAQKRAASKTSRKSPGKTPRIRRR